ncbi:long-chain-fatty-acid--CoA ligase 5-like isoform X2 [Ostrea edulis]|uniref:long-chain-fatty-acid--CoA ligase 5-like isoform X2 n=1 Tax=Ostrea edulis TaxID=37623 RepID=UPI002095212C|nr:long-chain-fatty-acid--CoA ligase 5-like isoform X2 [Ostrea edulis]
MFHEALNHSLYLEKIRNMEYLKLLGAGAVTVAAVTTTTFYYLTSRPQPVLLPVDLEDQTDEVDKIERSRMSKICKNGKYICEFEDGEVQTLHDAFKHGARVSSNGKVYGWKASPTEPYQWISYNDVLVRAANIGAGLIAKGLQPENTTNVGIYSQNRVEYGITEQACFMYSMVLVPLYDTLGPEACTHIINQAEIKTVICDKNVKVNAILDKINETPNLKIVILVEEPTSEIKKRAASHSIDLLTYSELEALGEQKPQEPKPAKPDDLCVLCYTSGTTGLPKGAMLTHRGTLATVVAAATVLKPGGVDISPEDTLISYLPLAHSYERLLESYCVLSGARIGFFQGDVKLLMDDIKELQPTLFPSVPRLLNRVYDKVMNQINEGSSIKRKLFNMAIASKENELKRNIIRKDSIWDKVVFKKIQASLGGKVKLITTGSAPLSPKVLHFLRCCVGCPIIEGYGQTESHAICTVTLVGDPDTGNVGPPLPCCEIKLADVEDMNYYAKDNKGEVCIKGPNVFLGYYRDPAKTEEALDKDGWLHTGDIGQWLENGTLKIIDRKKNIFKLAQGEYIAPEKIENVYVRSQLVAQVFIHGESLKSCLVGVVVPDPEVLPNWAKTKLNVSQSMEELCSNPDVKKEILADMTKIGKTGGLHSFEQVKDIFLYPELFSVENGLLTPTFKTKRHELKVKFQSQIAEMYTNLV